MKKNFLYIFLLILGSCATTTQFQKFTQSTEIENNKARIYVIRPGFKGGAVSTAIYCNDVLIGKTGGNGYLCWDVVEGKYTIGNTQIIHAGITLGSVNSEDLFIINAKVGKIYYLKQYPHFGGFSFDILSKEEGESYLKGKSKPKVNYTE